MKILTKRLTTNCVNLFSCEESSVGHTNFLLSFFYLCGGVIGMLNVIEVFDRNTNLKSIYIVQDDGAWVLIFQGHVDLEKL